jgi:hypothetical protein
MLVFIKLEDVIKVKAKKPLACFFALKIDVYKFRDPR